MQEVTIIGGGIAGLVSALQLAKAGFSVNVIEKGSYPSHKVCGEYISNEVIGFLKSLDAYPEQLAPVAIRHFLLTSLKGKSVRMPLDLGGFGISRYAFDSFLYKKAQEAGVRFILKNQVIGIRFLNNSFRLTLANGHDFASQIVIGAFGKRSKLDKQLDRPFIQHRSPFLAVKYHIHTKHPSDTIALHNFEGGYCGISEVENGKFNLCYLGRREHLKKYRTINEMENRILKQNPFLRDIFDTAEFLFPKPLVINEISFGTKSPVENHVLMTGDSAGLITPLCGNGIALAIHSARILAETIILHYRKSFFNRQEMEKNYSNLWNQHFSRRLWYGRQIQRLFGSYLLTESSIALTASFPFIGK
ncbi:NAD(P)/FAD-dependent oxidoreductase, partial [Xanthovirga aplysinae]|uniref:NAD(P)/FAD-dependent oxidoreductase n=1 Tax=Xanthovirga aplysinae TaxID=2529853 RepID=UPI0012BBEABF